MFYSYNPTKILNGIGALEQMHRELQGVKDIIVVHGDSLKCHEGMQDYLRSELSSGTVEFVKVPPGDPALKSVSETGCRFCGRRPFLLGVGGGRVLDFTKALAVYAGNGFTGDELFSSDHFAWTNTLRFGVIATRPGSGSEFNNAFILSDENSWKTSLFSLFTYPEFCIHDPKFFESLSSLEYRFGLFDAVIHVLDQFVVDRPDSLVVDELALSHLKMLGRLARSAQEPKAVNYQQLAWVGSMVSSGVLTRGVNASWRCHELAHALASVTHSVHGLSLAFLAPAVFEKSCAAPSRYGHALESLASGLGFGKLFTISDFIKELFGNPVQIEISKDLTSLSVQLAKHCPQYNASLIEDILRSSIHEQ